jgi:hypothetical protein
LVDRAPDRPVWARRVEMYRQTSQEDHLAVEAVQRNLCAFADFKAQPLPQEEVALVYFHSLLIDATSGAAVTA